MLATEPSCWRDAGLTEAAHEDRLRVNHGRRALEGREHPDVVDGSYLFEDRVGVLLGQVAHVHVDDTSVGHFFKASPPRILPRLIDGSS